MVGDLPALARCGHSTCAPARRPIRWTRRRPDPAPAATTRAGTRRACESAAPRARRPSRARLAHEQPKIAADRMLIAGNWKMYKGAHQAREFAAQIRRLGDRWSERRRRRVPAVRGPRRDDPRPRRRERRGGLCPERALAARRCLHGRGVRADAARAGREGGARRPFRAPAALRRHRRDRAPSARRPRSTRVCP